MTSVSLFRNRSILRERPPQLRYNCGEALVRLVADDPDALDSLQAPGRLVRGVIVNHYDLVADSAGEWQSIEARERDLDLIVNSDNN